MCRRKKQKKLEEQEQLQVVEAPMAQPRLTYTFRVLNMGGPIPVAKPNSNIQNQPAIQPINMQVGQMGGWDDFDDDDYDYNEDFY